MTAIATLTPPADYKHRTLREIWYPGPTGPARYARDRVITKLFDEGLTYERIAGMIDVSVATINTRLRVMNLTRRRTRSSRAGEFMVDRSRDTGK